MFPERTRKEMERVDLEERYFGQTATATQNKIFWRHWREINLFGAK